MRITHKFGIQVPKTVDKVYKIDQQTGTTFWKKSIEKEITNVHFAFEFLKGVTSEQTREGRTKTVFEYVVTQMIFDIKMDGKFIHRAILVAGGHRTATP